MNKLQKIGKIEAIGLMVMIIINQLILNLTNTILISTGSSSWINVIYISILAILFGLLVCKLFKPFSSYDILDISDFLGGKILKTIVGILYVTFFMFFAGILLRYLANTLKIIYFQDTPIIFLVVLFLIPVAITCKLKLKAISQVNLMLMPVLLITILVILFSTSKYFVYQRIFPILGFGFNQTFVYGITNIFSFSAFAYLYFLIPFLKEPKQLKKITLTSIILSAIYLFLSVICMLMIFPFISFSDEMLSIYLLTRMIEFGRFFQRIDAIFIFIWILCTLSFLSISTFFVTYILKKLTKIKNYTEVCYSICAILFSIAIIIKNIADIKILQNTILKYFTLFLVFILSLVILILANIKLKKKK